MVWVKLNSCEEFHGGVEADWMEMVDDDAFSPSPHCTPPWHK